MTVFALTQRPGWPYRPALAPPESKPMGPSLTFERAGDRLIITGGGGPVSLTVTNMRAIGNLILSVIEDIETDQERRFLLSLDAKGNLPPVA
jgi:hypothetical protein